MMLTIMGIFASTPEMLTKMSMVANIAPPPLNLTLLFIRLLGLIPLIGGYLIIRESRGNTYWEILGVILIVLATVMPQTPNPNDMAPILDAFFLRFSVMVLLLGIAFIRDGGLRMLVGLMLALVSGLVFLPK